MKRELTEEETSPCLLGIGLSVPECSFKQTDAIEKVLSTSFFASRIGDFLRGLYLNSGVAKRGSVLLKKIKSLESPQQIFFPKQKSLEDMGPGTKERMMVFEKEAPRLALESARLALLDAGIDPGEITHLVLVSCTGFSSPGIDLILINGLPLPPGVERVQIGFMGCHGMINGFRVAKAFAEQDPKNKVLLTSVELTSLHYYYGQDVGALIANALFADGSASCVIGATNPTPRSWIVKATGSFFFPNTEKDMSWRITDHGFEMRLSSKVPGLIGTHLKPWLLKWLEKEGLGLEDIRSWAVHPGWPRVMDSVEENLSLPKGTADVSREILREHGNMSSATILFIIDKLKRAEAPRPCVALGFGPGLVVEATLFT
jgi:prepilin-type processing-associated H-X9-DG protein